MSLDETRLAAAMRSGGVSSAPIHRAVLDAALRSAGNPGVILDFGSGTGGLLPLLAAAYPRAELHAVDIMERPGDLPPAVTWRRGDLNTEMPIPASTYDLVLAVEVIEHLENPRQTVREVARLLRPGGVAVLSTPNTGSIRSLVTLAFRGHHAQFDNSNYPAHITPVGEVDFWRMAAEAGLALDRFFYTDDGVVPKLLSRRWRDVPLVGRRLRGRRFSDNFGAVLRKPGSAASG